MIPPLNESPVAGYGPPLTTKVSAVTVDLSMLGAYDELQVEGESSLVVELLDLYLVDAPQQVSVMRAALAQGDWPALKRQAHCLRGSSGNLGALQLALICVEIEELQSGDLFTMQGALLSCLEHELARVFEILRGERQRRLL